MQAWRKGKHTESLLRSCGTYTSEHEQILARQDISLWLFWALEEGHRFEGLDVRNLQNTIGVHRNGPRG